MTSTKNKKMYTLILSVNLMFGSKNLLSMALCANWYVYNVKFKKYQKLFFFAGHGYTFIEKCVNDITTDRYLCLCNSGFYKTSLYHRVLCI